jgi:biopolymer transport protein ExbB/TolQ
MKGIFSIGLVMVGVGSIIWLIRSNEVVKQPPATAVDSERPVAASAQKQQVSSLVKSGKTEVPESPRHRTGEIERHQAEETSLAHLKKAVSAQEEKVEERRKVLATIVRTKGIIYKGSDADHSDGISTSL